MRMGILIAVLGILGIVGGAAMYALPFHKDIGLGGVGLGVVLLIVGVWASRSKPMAQPRPTGQPTTP